MSDEPTRSNSPTEPTSVDIGDRLTATLQWLPGDRQRAALWVVTFALIAVLVYVAWRYVGTLVMGVFVYYVTRPVFRRIHTRIASRTLAVGVTLLTAALPLLLIVGWAFAILVNSLSDLVSSEFFVELESVVQPYIDLTAFIAELGAFVDRVLEDPTALADLEFGPALTDLAASVVDWLGVAFNAGIHGFIVLIIVFYLLRDDYRIADWSRRTFLGDDGVLVDYFRTVDRDLHNVYFGNILNALLTGVLASVVYTLLNLVAPSATRIPEAAFLGLLVGVASLIPVIGIKLVTWPVSAYLFGRSLWLAPESLWFPVVFLLVSFVVVDYIPDQLLRPYVSGRTLHVGAVMLAYTIGPLLFGWYGIFLAPLLFVAIFEFGRLVFPWLLDGESAGTAIADRAGGGPEPSPAPDPSRSSDEPVDDGPAESSDDREFPGPTGHGGSGGSE